MLQVSPDYDLASFYTLLPLEYSEDYNNYFSYPDEILVGTFPLLTDMTLRSYYSFSHIEDYYNPVTPLSRKTSGVRFEFDVASFRISIYNKSPSSQESLSLTYLLANSGGYSSSNGNSYTMIHFNFNPNFDLSSVFAGD